MKTIYLIIFMLITNLTFSQIQGSAHDFSTNQWSLDNPCKPCHISEETGELRIEPLWGGSTPVQSFVNDNSKLCLSCHENIDVSQVDMRNHPVSVDYPFYKFNDFNSDIIELPLFKNKIECASCHDVHNTNNIPKLLRVSNENSQLCLTCHIK